MDGRRRRVPAAPARPRRAACAPASSAPPTATVARGRGGACAAARAARARPRGAQPPRIITRSEWGGDVACRRARPRRTARCQLAFVHHTVTANDYAPEESAAIVLGIARYHRDSNGWNDIGYNFLVDKYGQVFEGRAGGIDQRRSSAPRRRAATASPPASPASALHASRRRATPGLEAVAQLLGWKLASTACPSQGQVTVTSLGGETNRYRSGTPSRSSGSPATATATRRAAPATSLYAQLPDLRTRAARYATARRRRPRPCRWPPCPCARADVVRGIAPLQVTGALQLQRRRAARRASPVEVLYAAPGGAARRTSRTRCAAPTAAFAATVTLGASGTVAACYLGDGVRPPADSPGPRGDRPPELAVAARRAASVRRAGGASPSAARSRRPAPTRVAVHRRAPRRPPLARRAPPAGRRAQRRATGARAARRAGRYRVTVAVPGAGSAAPCPRGALSAA